MICRKESINIRGLFRHCLQSPTLFIINVYPFYVELQAALGTFHPVPPGAQEPQGQTGFMMARQGFQGYAGPSLPCQVPLLLLLP